LKASNGNAEVHRLSGPSLDAGAHEMLLNQIVQAPRDMVRLFVSVDHPFATKGFRHISSLCNE